MTDDTTSETGRPTRTCPAGVHTRDDFGNYVLEVLADYRETGAAEWENNTLERFLDGLSAFSLGRDDNPQDQEQATWQLFAEILHVATGYE